MARALAAQGNTTKADAAIAAALRAKPDFAPALWWEARVHEGKGDFDTATKIVDEVLAKAPDDPDALVVKGDLLRFGSNDAADAIALYRRALAAKPSHLLAFTAMLEQFFSQNDLEAARTALEAMKKARPGHPQTVYFQTRLAAQKGELQSAEELV